MPQRTVPARVSQCPAWIRTRGTAKGHSGAGICLPLSLSEQSARADTHEELIKTLKELKVHLPADKKARGKASTLATLKYALQSVKQVRGTLARALVPNLKRRVSSAPRVQLRLC